MKTQTPKEWQDKKLAKTTTAYVNEVMIPETHLKVWELERKAFEEAKKRGIDLSLGVESSEPPMPFNQEKKIRLWCFTKNITIENKGLHLPFF